MMYKVIKRTKKKKIPWLTNFSFSWCTKWLLLAVYRFNLSVVAACIVGKRY
jgi:hypothetical protein